MFLTSTSSSVFLLFGIVPSPKINYNYSDKSASTEVMPTVSDIDKSVAFYKLVYGNAIYSDLSVHRSNRLKN